MQNDAEEKKRMGSTLRVPVATEEFQEAEWVRKRKVTILVKNVHPKEAMLLLQKCVALRIGFQARIAGDVDKAVERAREFSTMSC